MTSAPVLTALRAFTEPRRRPGTVQPGMIQPGTVRLNTVRPDMVWPADAEQLVLPFEGQQLTVWRWRSSGSQTGRRVLLVHGWEDDSALWKSWTGAYRARGAEQGRDLRQVTAAVVGANGVVAFGIARTIAPQVGKVILVGRDATRLERSANTLRRAVKSTEITTTTSYDALREAELIFTATSDPEPVIFPQHVRPGTWIFDEGRPADVDARVAQVPGVRVIPGGVVRPPGTVSSRIDLQFGEGQVPACLAETLIIAATGEHGRQSLGPQTLTENVQFFVQEAQRLQFDVVE